MNWQYSFGLALLFRLGVSHCWDYPSSRGVSIGTDHVPSTWGFKTEETNARHIQNCA